jgi:hypothetical protein
MLHNLVDIEFTFRARTDKRHIALYNIPKLRKFIEVMSPKECSNMSQASFLIVLEELRTIFFCIHSHASEFIYVERFAESADSFLFKDSRSIIFSFYEKIAYSK